MKAFRERLYRLQGPLKTPDAHVAILDGDGTIIATNRADEPVPEADLAVPGQSLRHLLAPGIEGEIAHEVLDAIEGLLKGGQETYETEYAWDGGSGERWFHLTATRFTFDEETRIAVTHRDVTTRHEARRERETLLSTFKEQDTVLRKLAENLPQALFVVDGDMEDILFISSRASDLWGLPLEGLTEDPLAWLQVVHEDDIERVETLMVSSLEAAQRNPNIVPEAQFRIRHPKKGEVRWIRVQAVPIHEDGKLAQLVGIVEDITSARQEAEQAHRRTRSLARSTELEQILFATSHSLQTHIRQAISFAQLLQRDHADALPNEANELIERVVTNVRELETLHRALNRYANVTDGDSAHEPVHLDAIVDDAKERLAGRLDAADATVDAQGLPTVQGDREQLLELFTELLNNAIQFRREDPLRVTIQATPEERRWRIDVEDNGQGFDPAYAEGLFRPFRQLDPTPGDESVGIGLTICRRIVENHEGAISAHANPDQGTTMRLTLPAAEDA